MKKEKIKLGLKKSTIARLNMQEQELIKAGGESNFTTVDIITIGGGLPTRVSCGYIDTKPCDRES